MKTTSDCATIRENLCDYIDGALTPTATTQLEAHLTGCASCRRSLEQMSKIESLMQQTVAARGVSEDFDTTAQNRVRSAAADPAVFLDAAIPVDQPEREG